MVAVATPCCPAPVSAMMRFLPMRLASRACPTALLILCEPVCASSSRFNQICGQIPQIPAGNETAHAGFGHRTTREHGTEREEENGQE